MSEIDSNPFADPAFSHPFQVTLLATLAASVSVGSERVLPLLRLWALGTSELLKRCVDPLQLSNEASLCSLRVKSVNIGAQLHQDGTWVGLKLGLPSWKHTFVILLLSNRMVIISLYNSN